MSFKFDVENNTFNVEPLGHGVPQIETDKEHYVNSQTMICNLTFKEK